MYPSHQYDIRIRIKIPNRLRAKLYEVGLSLFPAPSCQFVSPPDQNEACAIIFLAINVATRSHILLFNSQHPI